MSGNCRRHHLDQFKSICQIKHTRHRSAANFVVNLLAALAAYTYQEKKSSLNLYPDDLAALPATIFKLSYVELTLS